MSAQPWEPRLARLEGSYEQIDRRLSDLASHMDARFAQVDARFAQVDNGLWRLTALVVGTWATTILTILFHH